MKISDLSPAEYNPRTITPEKLEMLRKSMAEYGDLSGIVYNRQTGRLIGGHQRLKTLEPDWKITKTDIKDKTGTVAAGHIETPDGRWSYREVDWPEKKEMAANIAANKHGGEFDWPKLKDLIIEIDDGAFDIELTGFSAEELQETFGITGPEQGGLTDDDAVPDVPEKPKTRTGDLYIMGAHRVLCGDSTKADDVERLMDGQKADMVFTDPPYGMNLDTDFNKMTSEKSFHKGGTHRPVIGDDVEYDPKHLLDYFSYCKEIFLWGADYYIERIERNYENLGSWVVWDKRLEDSADKMYGSCFELCWSKQKHKRDIARIKWAGFFGLSSEDTKNRIHPTQKPVTLIEWFFERYKGNLVIDLFLGSGSTLIACEKTNRKCYGMEIDPHYCDVIVKRWEEYTGQKAKLIRGGDAK